MSRHLMGRHLFAALSALAALALPLASPAQTTNPAATPTASAPVAPQRVQLQQPAQSLLWVGNSFFYYNNSLHNHVGLLAGSGGQRLRGTSATISGAGLDWHDIGALIAPGRLGRYSFVGDNEVRFNPPGRAYDAAVLMDCSQCPVHPQLQQAFHDTVKDASAKLKAAGIQPVLFMSWAYQDKPEMTAPLAEQYTRAANANDLLVIPAGLAFARAVATIPGVQLYVADKRHPSLAGSYLAACTSYAALTGRSPVGLAYTADLPADLAAQLQQVAWDTVRAYTAR